MKRIFWLILTACVAVILFYLSRFWAFSLWSRDGLFGIKALRPQGDLIDGWVRGTDLAPFDLLIWAVGGFIVLTVLQKLYDRLNPPSD